MSRYRITAQRSYEHFHFEPVECQRIRDGVTVTRTITLIDNSFEHRKDFEMTLRDVESSVIGCFDHFVFEMSDDDYERFVVLRSSTYGVPFKPHVRVSYLPYYRSLRDVKRNFSWSRITLER